MTPAARRGFGRIAVVNRGEPAMRLIHAVRELDEPLTVIALYTEDERHALFVRHADEAYPVAGYLDHGALERTLTAARADAVWVGWGFVAEHPGFVELCERLGIVFIGPPSAVMRALGDKIAAKRLAESVGIPVAPWSGGPVESELDAARHAERIGFPLLIKASAGGGGRGIRRVELADELPAALRSARAEALDAVGDGTLLMEAVIAPARHIEVQVIADAHGAVWAVGLRDCTCQRRNQKVIEESGSTALAPRVEREIMDAAVRLARSAGYRSTGTVEFLYEPATGRFSFMEVNARLQVEHPVTEVTTGLDLVKLQLHVAAGGRLEGEPPAPNGWAVEARLNAEDPARGFVPTPGRILLMRLPTGPGLRIDAGIAEGDMIPAAFDSMIAKVIAHGRTRAEALARLRRALAETTIVVDGGTTNQGFLLELLSSDELRSGNFDTRWLDRAARDGELLPVRHANIALVQAAIALADAETAIDRARFFAFARRGRPQSSAEPERTIELRHCGHAYRLAVAHEGPNRYRVRLDGTEAHVVADAVNAHEGTLTVAGRTYRTLTSLQGASLLVEIDGVSHRIAREDGGIVRSTAPVLVAAIPVVQGQEVAAGDVVAVVEAMKMEVSLTADRAGRVREIFVTPNTQVGAGAPLLALELPETEEPAPAAGPRVTLPGDPPSSCDARHEALQRLEWLLCGYDVTPAQAAGDAALVGVPREPDRDLDAAENRLLARFADVRNLSRRQSDADAEGGVELLFAFLRALDADAVPQRFVTELERVLAAHGIDSLDRTPALEEACYRVFLAHQRAGLARDAIVSILERRVGHPGAARDDVLRDTLVRIADAELVRDPILADIARELAYREFEEPIIEGAKAAAYAEAERLLEHPAPAAVAPLVSCTQPLAPMLTTRLRSAPDSERDLLLEVMTRRYYRLRELGDFRSERFGALPFLTCRYEHDGGARRLAVAFVGVDGVRDAAAEAAQWARDLDAGELASIDLYAAAPHDDAMGERLAAALAGVDAPPSLRRVVVALADPARGLGMDAVDIFTFVRDADGRFTEDRWLRGLHPVMAERLSLWRLSAFELERLPSAADVHLFRAVARENARDERLYAAAEVRDLTALRDDDGTLASLPELESIFTEVLAAMRAFQAPRPMSRRPQWNRITLHAWPVIDLTAEEIRTVVARLTPQAAGLGIELVMLYGRAPDAGGEPRDRVLRFFPSPAGGVVVEAGDPPARPLGVQDEGQRRIVLARRRGMLHPAEIVKLLAPAGRTAGAHQAVGDFRELDLDADGRLAEVDRQPATNGAGIVVGLVRNFTARHPEGMERVLLAGDPTKSLGALAEPECRRIIAALDLAEELRVPVEWFALSAGARIAMDSGTENMDWIAAVLRRIVEFTQAGGEINVVVAGVNVGAQPYWNAEATMLMHTRGILVMTPQSAMVLTGKQALDFSGAVSAEDNFGIGGYERIMGPNGQAQHWAADLAGACRVLLSHYEHAYVAPGERFPRRAETSDPFQRDVRPYPHILAGAPPTIGELLSDKLNPERKLAFDIRTVMRAAADADHPPLERWPALAGGEAAVVWDAHLGGWPVMLLGIESHPLPRRGLLPADGPETWTSGTLFPRSAKKLARALNAASGRRAVVVLANLAGFDGSPESMRDCQLEFGAEIGRAVVNFRGPIVFCVVSRYHGGAFVVFSQRLNEGLEALALEGSKASVIGGGPAAGVVFARDVAAAAAADPEVAALDAQLATAEGSERARLRTEREAVYARVRAAKQGEFAARFDAVHSVERAVLTGSVRSIIPLASMRPRLIEAVERGMRETLEREAAGALAHVPNG